MGREPAQYVQSAALAFIGRVVSVETEGRAPRTRIAVLHAIHGRPGREQRIPAASDPCGRTFESGEIALVFVARDRSTSICAGNYAIEVQLARMLEYLALGPQPRVLAPREAIAAAVALITTRALAPFKSPMRPPPQPMPVPRPMPVQLGASRPDVSGRSRTSS